MPGIFGIISKRPKEINESELNVMRQSVFMESFYNSGTLTLADMATYVGWTCHKGSFSDCLPITNENGDIHLIYYGENFEDIEKIDKLKGRNHKFNKRNASYIVHMYEELGENCFVMLNGRHHGILIDKRNNKTILFNDRYGLQRIYYFEGENAFYFSTEAKAILKVFPQLRQVDVVSLAELFLFNCVLANKSLFRNINLLPNAAFWTFQGNERANKKECYFEPSDLESQTLLEREFHYEKLIDVIQKTIARYYRAEDKAGVFLTNDLDNRVILANAKFGQGKLSCYSLGDMSGNTNNEMVARETAEAVGQTLQIITRDVEYWNQYKKLAEKAIYIADGTVSVTGVAELYLNQKAREIAPIQLSGNYGGAILRKKKLIHLNQFERSIFNKEFQDTLNRASETYEEFPSPDLTYNLSNGLSWAESGRLSIAQSQLIVRTPFLDNDFVRLMYRAPDEIMDSDEVSLRLIKDSNLRLAKVAAISPSTPSIVNNCRKILAGIFRKFNRSSAMRIDGPHFPLDGAAFRNELSGYVKEILLDERALKRPYINKPFIEQIVLAHTKGMQNYTNEINLLLTAELVHRLFID